MVVEAGTYELPGGGLLVAGTASVNQTLQTVSLGSNFAGPPLVVSQVMTTNGALSAAVSRLATVQAGSFQVRVQEQKSADGIHSNETVGDLALLPGSGTTPGVAGYQGIVTGRTVTDAWATQSFSPAFAAAPLVLSATQTNAESQPAVARPRSVLAGSVQVHVEEENSDGSGTAHAAEKVALLAFAQGGFLYDQALIPQPPSITYTYDADGHRVKRTADPDGTGGQPPTSEYFVYDGDQLAMSFDTA